MVERGVYTNQEKKMIENWRKTAEKNVGWLGETPSEEVPYPVFHRIASPDLIRHMAYAADYKNPLWRDKSYARNTRWGSIIAPPFFLYCISQGGPYNILKVPSEVGIQVGVTFGEDWDFFKPIYPGDSFKVWVGLPDFQDVTQTGEPEERRFRIVRESRFINQKNEVVGILRLTDTATILPPSADVGNLFRVGAEMGGMPKSYFKSFKETEEYVYTKEEIEAIDRMYDAEKIRGAKIRYWEDVNIGDELPPVVMGPITVWDSVVELQGIGLATLPMMEVRRQTPDRVMIDPLTNIPHKSIEIHLTEKSAKIGNIYSTTLIQHTIEHVLGRMITNWMGDDGFLRRFYWFKMANTPIGDTVFGRGKVIKKYIDDKGDYLVDLDTWLETIRGYVSNSCPATVRLVSKKEQTAGMDNYLSNPIYEKNITLQEIIGKNYLKPGDRVRIKERSDWPMPSEYKPAGVEGEVFNINEEVEGYAWVLLDRDVTGIDTRVPLGLRIDALEKI